MPNDPVSQITGAIELWRDVDKPGFCPVLDADAALAAGRAMVAEIERLRAALLRARTHGLTGRMWHAGEAFDLGAWIDAGMVGPLPEVRSPFVREELARAT